MLSVHVLLCTQQLQFFWKEKPIKKMISSENKMYGKNFHDFRYAYMYGKSRKFIQSRTQNILFDLTYVTQSFLQKISAMELHFI